MATSKHIAFLDLRDWMIKGFSLIAAGVAATLEIFKDAFGQIATVAVGATGTGYTAEGYLYYC